MKNLHRIRNRKIIQKNFLPITNHPHFRQNNFHKKQKQLESRLEESRENLNTSYSKIAYFISIITLLQTLGCSTTTINPTQPKVPTQPTLWEKYGDNIIYKDITQIIKESESSQKLIELPEEIEYQIKAYKPKLKNPKQMENLVLTEAQKLGYNLEKIKALQAGEAIELHYLIVASKLNPFSVDLDKDFIKKTWQA